MDLNVALKRIIETGKIEIGTEKTIDKIMNGDARLVMIASNCPKKTREKIEKFAKVENVPIINYPGTSLQLGEACGKPFVIASLSVIDSGDVQLGELKA